MGRGSNRSTIGTGHMRLVFSLCYFYSSVQLSICKSVSKRMYCITYLVEAGVPVCDILFLNMQDMSGSWEDLVSPKKLLRDVNKNYYIYILDSSSYTDRGTKSVWCRSFGLVS